MEEMIKKIIDIDQKAFEKKQNGEQIIKENQKKLKEIYSKMEKEIIEKAKVEAEKNYKIGMESSYELINDIKSKGDKEVKVLEESFHKIHRSLSQSLFNEIFELS